MRIWNWNEPIVLNRSIFCRLLLLISNPQPPNKQTQVSTKHLLGCCSSPQIVSNAALLLCTVNQFQLKISLWKTKFLKSLWILWNLAILNSENWQFCIFNKALNLRFSSGNETFPNVFVHDYSFPQIISKLFHNVLPRLSHLQVNTTTSLWVSYRSLVLWSPQPGKIIKHNSIKWENNEREDKNK